jgi:hypothetical protein
MLDQLVRNVERGRIRNQRSPPAVGVLSEITTPTTRGFATSPHLTSLFHSSDPRMKEVHCRCAHLGFDSNPVAVRVSRDEVRNEDFTIAVFESNPWGDVRVPACLKPIE